MGYMQSAVFGATTVAFRATIAGQSALSAEPWPENITLRVSMALHTGAAEVREGDYYGSDVHRADRQMSAASGSQILLSAATTELVRDQMIPGATLSDLGKHHACQLMPAFKVFGAIVALIFIDDTLKIISRQ